MTEVAGLVLAAGAGRRFGGPKALVRPDPDGPSWVEQAVCRVAASGVGTVIVAVGAEAEDVSGVLLSGAWARDCHVRVPVLVEMVEVEDWADGMGASLRAGIAWARAMLESMDALLVTLVDLPDVDAGVYRRVLAEAAGAGRAALVRAAYDGVPGHPVLIGRDHWNGVCAAAIGDRGARDYLTTAQVTLVECGDLASGRDVDRPGDL